MLRESDEKAKALEAELVRYKTALASATSSKSLAEHRQTVSAPSEASWLPQRSSAGQLTSEVEALRDENARLADGLSRLEADRVFLHGQFQEQLEAMMVETARKAREFEDNLREAAVAELRQQQAAEARIAKDKDTLLAEGRRIQKDRDLQAQAIEAERQRFAHEWASANEIVTQRLETMSSELAAAQAYAREVEAQRVQAQQPLFKGNGSDFDQSFSAAVTTGLPESYGLAGSYGAARGSDQSLLFGRGYGLFGNPNTFSQSGLATPIGSVQAMTCPQVPFESMTLRGTCVMRPVATAVGTSGAAAAGSGTAKRRCARRWSALRRSSG
jgi:hypothetical protein